MNYQGRKLGSGATACTGSRKAESCKDEEDNVGYIQRLFDETIQERNDALVKHDQLSRRHERLKCQLCQFSDKYQAQNAELLRQKEENNGLLKDNVALRNEINQLKAELREVGQVDEKLAQWEVKLEKLKAENTAQQRALETVRRQNSKLQSVLEGVENDRSSANSLEKEKLATMLTKLDCLKKINDELVTKKERLEKLLAKATRDYEEANRNLKAAHDRLGSQERELESYKDAMIKLRSKLMAAAKSEQSKQQATRCETVKCQGYRGEKRRQGRKGKLTVTISQTGPKRGPNTMTNICHTPSSCRSTPSRSLATENAKRNKCRGPYGDSYHCHTQVKRYKASPCDREKYEVRGSNGHRRTKCHDSRSRSAPGVQRKSCGPREERVLACFSECEYVPRGMQAGTDCRGLSSDMRATRGEEGVSPQRNSARRGARKCCVQ